MTLDNADFADLVILILAAPLILGTAWAWMRNHARRDAIRRWPR